MQAGAMAVILQSENLTPSQMKSRLINQCVIESTNINVTKYRKIFFVNCRSTENQIKGLKPRTPNKTLYVPCL